MIENLKVTEMSLSYEVRGRPKLPISHYVPLAIDTRGNDTERAIEANIVLPNWMMNFKRGYMRFVYVSEFQHINCTFKEQQSVLTFYGIKCNLPSGNLDAVFDILGVESLGIPVTMYRATLVLDVGFEWDRHTVADIVTNDPEISQVAAVSETVYTLCDRSLFVISVETSHGKYARMTLRQDDQDCSKAVITMSRLPTADASAHIADVAVRIFDIYAQHCEKPVHSKPKLHRKTSGITHLRNECPNLFINNYTRECPVLPIMLSEKDAGLQEDNVIFYPVDSPMGRFYTAPDGYFVGLKKNRLANKHTFSHLVTCYLNNHMLRKNSETYMYYMGQEHAKQSRMKSSKRIPKFLDYMKLGYSRQRASSFVNAVEAATGWTMDTDHLPWCPQITKQETWNMNDAQIMEAIYDRRCGPSAYRYFEELLEISIHVIEIKGSMSDIHASKVPDYIWTAVYNRHIVIFETEKSTYGKTHLSYDFLVGNNKATLFGDDDPVISSVLSKKRELFAEPPDVPNVVEQLIDERGKCRVAVTSEGNYVNTLTRPFKAAVMLEQACFFDVHMAKLNAIRKNIGLPTTDLYKRSTGNTLYFSNDPSFYYWYNRCGHP